MQTATAAGMFSVGALWGFRYEAELKTNGAKMLINRPEDLIDLPENVFVSFLNFYDRL